VISDVLRIDDREGAALITVRTVEEVLNYYPCLQGRLIDGYLSRESGSGSASRSLVSFFGGGEPMESISTVHSTAHLRTYELVKL